MGIRQGKCINFGNCSNADSRKTLDIADGQDFVCPECGRTLHLLEQRRGGSSAAVLGGIVVILILLGALVWWMLGGEKKETPSPVAVAPVAAPAAPAAPPPAKRDVILRLAGSNTIGASLAPALAEAFLKSQGTGEVRREPGGKPEEVTLVGRLPAGEQAIAVSAHGTGTAFAALATQEADIGMASRRITQAELAKLKALGDMTAPSREHVLAMDGVAVIVHRDNPLATLTRDQVAALFSGVVADWTQVKGRGGRINVYTRDDKSGTFDTFKSLVLGSTALVAGARRFEDSKALVEAVAADPAGIGFVGLGHVRDVKVLAVAEAGATPLMANRFTVATEDYPLSRRLYLYSPDSNATARRFIDFALSRAGQDIVKQQGFVELTVSGEKIATPSGAPSDYAKLTAGALRLSTNLRFNTGSAMLDNKALRDLDRVAEFLTDIRKSGEAIMMFGFADSTGQRAANLTLSKDRARAVEEEFKRRGLKPGVVTGLGQELPVADNATAEGREKNRRVEVWVKS